MNQLVLVGKIKEFVKINNDCQMKIAVQRYFKNINGEYETDLIPIYAFGIISQNIMEFCKEEDIVGVKGRIESDGENIKIIAEKVTFLSSRKDEK